MAKFTIFLPDELLTDIDRYAEQIGESRSGVIREASARYLAEERSAQSAMRKRAAVADSLELFESLSRLPGLDGRSGSEILREARGPLGSGGDATESHGTRGRKES